MPEPIGLEKRVGLHYNPVGNAAVAITPLIREIRRKNLKTLGSCESQVSQNLSDSVWSKN
jgi:hypothetical protein